MKTVFIGISELHTMSGAARKDGRRVLESDLGIIPNAAMVAEKGRITWVGPHSALPSQGPTNEVNFNGAVVIPAFLECHTHLAFAGSRAQEFDWRVEGMSYQEIAARGGGIVATVNATRKCSDDDLLELMQKRANRFLEQGVTTLEVKSGYGLNEATERKCLRLANRILGPRVIRTFLGPHSVPPEFKSKDSYFEFILNDLLPKIAADLLAERVDIFVEAGFFTSEQSDRYFAKANELGLQIVAHVEQLSHSGGALSAIKAGAISVDHIVNINPEEIALLGQSQTAAVLLPAADFYLKMAYPPARALIESGACVALSTDFNPGTSPTQDLSLIGVLARIEMKMSFAEVLSAWTVGAAKALARGHELGSLERGKLCDFIVLSGNAKELFYAVGEHPIASVWQAGEKLYEKKF
jgi:imidazolonepropionase